jgi:hypothetical protein
MASFSNLFIYFYYFAFHDLKARGNEMLQVFLFFGFQIYNFSFVC